VVRWRLNFLGRVWYRAKVLKSEKNQVSTACQLENRKCDDTVCDPSNSQQAIGEMDQVTCQNSRACLPSRTLATHQRISRHKREVGPGGNHDQDGETSNAKEVGEHAVTLAQDVGSRRLLLIRL
jgi:hypothetical protein